MLISSYYLYIYKESEHNGGTAADVDEDHDRCSPWRGVLPCALCVPLYHCDRLGLSCLNRFARSHFPIVRWIWSAVVCVGGCSCMYWPGCVVPVSGNLLRLVACHRCVRTSSADRLCLHVPCGVFYHPITDGPFVICLGGHVGVTKWCWGMSYLLGINSSTILPLPSLLVDGLVFPLHSCHLFSFAQLSHTLHNFFEFFLTIILERCHSKNILTFVQVDTQCPLMSTNLACLSSLWACCDRLDLPQQSCDRKHCPKPTLAAPHSSITYTSK